ncbi:hypothetical protein E4U57_001202 [Claviceps arundinis]|uniref:Uncharacterized protein n=1 Tax=Claviceps arundinis TaxID=1623583 RepID=A0ABQ7PBE8_9HYPO|nr:hypothetical protein E4U57_001202 [Claviceps arundinis]
MDDGRRGDAPSVRGTKNGPGAVWQIQYTSRNLLVDDFKNLGLLMPVPEAKQFKTDEAKTQSSVDRLQYAIPGEPRISGRTGLGKESVEFDQDVSDVLHQDR